MQESVTGAAAELSAGGADGVQAVGVVADLSEPSWLKPVEKAVGDREVGLFVANAGISHVGDFLTMTPETRRAMVAINALAVADAAAAFLPAMVERGRGGFLTTSSGSAVAGTGTVALYSATKAFGMNLSEAIGWELRDTGVDTLAFCGPSMETPAFKSHDVDRSQMAVPPVAPEEVVGEVLDHLPAGGRWLPAGIDFVAGLPREQQVDIISASTRSMYPWMDTDS